MMAFSWILLSSFAVAVAAAVEALESGKIHNVLIGRICSHQGFSSLKAKRGCWGNGSGSSNSSNSSSSSREVARSNILSLRGGGGSGGVMGRFTGIFQRRNNQKKKMDLLRITELEESVRRLEIQIRTSREESNQLRIALKDQSFDKRKEMSNNIQKQKQMEQKLRIEIQQLHDQIITIQGALEETTQSLEKERQSLKENIKQREIDQNQMDQMKITFQTQIQKEHLIMEEKMKNQLQTLQKEADLRLYNESEKQRSIANERVRIERELKEQAIEKERAKMRKLVKVLAEREKQANNNKQQKSLKKKNNGNSASLLESETQTASSSSPSSKSKDKASLKKKSDVKVTTSYNKRASSSAAPSKKPAVVVVAGADAVKSSK